MTDTSASDVPDSQKVKLLSPDDEQTRLIGKAIASETAGKILSSMGGREVTAMALAEELNTPVSTIMYHLENLASAGLIEVSRTRYSVKGREMKVYRLIDQVLIVSPKKFDVKAVLTRCAVLLSLPLGVACLLAILGLSQTSEENQLSDSAMGGAQKMEMDVACNSMERAMDAVPVPMEISSPIAQELSSPFVSLGDLAIGILIGAVIVILLGFLIDYSRQKL